MKRDRHLQLLDALRAYQYKGKFVGKVYDSPLSGAEAFTLLEIDADPTRSATDIAEILQLDKSTVSRVISKLKRGGYLVSKSSSKDRRRNVLQATSKGHEVLGFQDEMNTSLVEAFTKNISVVELSKLQRYLKRFANDSGATEVLATRHEHPIVIEKRRLARAYGVMGPSFVGSEFSSTQWNILTEIHEGKGSASPSDISDKLSIFRNTLSGMLKALEEQGLVARVQSTSDRRSYTLKLTSEGRSALRDIERRAKAQIKRGLKTFSQKEMDEFIHLYGRYVGVPELVGLTDEVSQVAVVSPQVSVKYVETEEERVRARAFLILELVRTNRYLQAPEGLVMEASFAYVLMRGERIVGLCEFQQQKKNWSLMNFASLQEEDALTQNFIRMALQKFFDTSGASRVLIPEINREYISTKVLEKGKERYVEAKSLAKWGKHRPKVL